MNYREIFNRPESDRPYPFNEAGRKVRETIKSRYKAGESISSLSDDYNLTISQVTIIVTQTPF